EATRLVEYVDKKITPTIREILLSEINLKKAIFYENKKERERVVPFLTNALKLAQKYNQQETIVHCLLLKADIDEIKAIENLKSALEIAETLKLSPLIGQVMYKLACMYVKMNEKEKAQYYGRKALLIYNDIKTKLKDINQNYYINRPEYVALLEI
ncbi:MAG: hypothetical protein ABIL14_02450, partial [candidate division WOR-3 bacterium]